MNTQVNINHLFINEGFLESSIVELKKPISTSIYKAQVHSGNIGTMNFLKDHESEKIKLSEVYLSALVGLFPYYPIHDELNSSLKISMYAKSKDYHKTLSIKLSKIIEKLQNIYPKAKFLSAVDSKPVLERDLAYRSGLGWIGKNTCLINKKNGSLFFIAEILTDLSVKDLKKLDTSFTKTPLYSDHCGTCTRCIDICPTKALKPHYLEVDKCISYRTIEKKEISKDVLKDKTHSWLFGCDLCQSVCPWNELAFGKDSMRDLEKWSVGKNQIKELEEILKASNKSLDKKYKEFPLSRARGKRLKRNALQVIYENKLSDFKALLKALDLGELEDMKSEVVNSL